MSNLEDVTVNINAEEIIRRKDQALLFAQAKLDTQVIKDSNVFCPQDEGTLRDSALLNSRIGSGEIRWATPYAKRLYYGVNFNFSRDKNPNARAKWFEEAKSRYVKDWLAIAQGAL